MDSIRKTVLTRHLKKLEEERKQYGGARMGGGAVEVTQEELEGLLLECHPYEVTQDTRGQELEYRMGFYDLRNDRASWVNVTLVNPYLDEGFSEGKEMAPVDDGAFRVDIEAVDPVLAAERAAAVEEIMRMRAELQGIGREVPEEAPAPVRFALWDPEDINEEDDD